MATKPTDKARRPKASKSHRKPPPVEEYEIDPAARPFSLFGTTEDKQSMRISQGVLDIVRDIAREEHKPAVVVVHDLLRHGLVRKGYLLPVERLVSKRLLTADGTVVRLRRLDGRRTTEVIDR